MLQRRLVPSFLAHQHVIALPSSPHLLPAASLCRHSRPQSSAAQEIQSQLDSHELVDLFRGLKPPKQSVKGTATPKEDANTHLRQSRPSKPLNQSARGSATEKRRSGDTTSKKHLSRVATTESKSAGSSQARKRHAAVPSVPSRTRNTRSKVDGHHLEPTNTDNITLDHRVLQDEAGAKAEVYTYAARSGFVPHFAARPLTQRVRGRKKKMFEVTIELPQQNIKVVAVARDLRAAEIAASLRFKTKAEEYHAEHSDDTIVIRDSSALHIGNVRQFFDYYKMVHRGSWFDVTITPVPFGEMGAAAFQGQATLNGEDIGEPVRMFSKKQTEELAYLTAAVALQNQEPELFQGFVDELRMGNGEILRQVSPLELIVDDEAALVMRETLHETRKAGLSDLHDDPRAEGEGAETGRIRLRRQLDPDQAKLRNFELRERLERFGTNPALAELRQKKDDLPMNHYRKQVYDLVDNNGYSIVVGATGSGKTTQVPQIMLEKAIRQGSGANCNVICTQPRRIAATSVARRVADERNESLQMSVGYHVRFDAKLPQLGGSITYCTTGILLQQLQHDPDSILDTVSHLVIDEVHERDILIDFLMIILKKVIDRRKALGKSTPKVVLMSATMDTELFANYFQHTNAEGNMVPCPSLSVPGRTFPVKERYMTEVIDTLQKSYPGQLQLLETDYATRDYIEAERRFSNSNVGRANAQSSVEMTGDGEAVIDWKRERTLSSEGVATISNEREEGLVPSGLVALTAAHVARTTTEGAILVFLPGLDEIVSVEKILRQQRPLGINFGDVSKYKLSILHSSLPASQTDVFTPVPAGCRKVILATNIAETSITIPDVQYVVDSGKHREKRYDQIRRITKLQCTWISKSSSKQRAGRAGRVQDGNYYALFPRERFQSMRTIGMPEMLRSDLDEICLDIKAQAFQAPIRDFLSEAIEPPPPTAVDASVMSLQQLEALTEAEELTPLGRLLASLPVHPALGKMIVLGIIFRCLDPMIILGAASAERPLFLNPLEARDRARKIQKDFSGDTLSDHIALINAVRKLRKIRDEAGYSAMQNYAMQNFIHVGAFKGMDNTANQIEDQLVQAGLIQRVSRDERFESEYGHPSLNENSSREAMIKALAVAGMHPNLGLCFKGSVCRTPREQNVGIHPGSVNYRRGKNNADAAPQYQLLTYSSMSRSLDGKSMFLRETTAVSNLVAALFGGPLRTTEQRGRILKMDHWLPFYVANRAGAYNSLKTLLEFRKGLDRLLSGAFQDLRGHRRERGGGLREGRFLADDEVRDRFANGVVELLERDYKQNNGGPPFDFEAAL
ncbi:MAG: hypothetical protein M1817_002937 [Caeruleum heppii]|nr:MAG: hypothetical protein M1817_002937 [Caeruleum heppii]